MKQKSFTSSGFELVTKRTRKREFLAEMNSVVPWAALVLLIEPHAPSGKTGRLDRLQGEFTLCRTEASNFRLANL